MDAQALFREGVLALRDKQDVAQARTLLTQSLKLDPNNEMAWLWLSRTTDDPQKKLQCLERALRLNPQNQQALALRDKLRGSASPSAGTPPSAKQPPPSSASVPHSLDDLRAAIEAPPPAAKQPPVIHALHDPSVAARPPLPPAAKQPPVIHALHDPHAAVQAPPPSRSLDDLRAAIDEPPPLIPAADAAPDPHAIDELLAEAERYLKTEDTEGAIEQWVRVLELQPDQPVAIQNAVRYLYKLGYKDDARELLGRAIDAGTTSVAIYLTAIDLARVGGEPGRADELREQVAALPTADEELILKTADYFGSGGQSMRAVDVVQKGLVTHPDSQALLLRMAVMQDEALGNKGEARRYYELAARGKKGKASKNAEKALSNFTPVVTDRERGSFWLALREAVGFGVIFVLLGWQDAGLDLLRLGSQRWLGVGLSLIGGYLLVTGLSAPQQQPLAAWLGGKVPAPKPAAADDGSVQDEPTALPIIPGFLRAALALVGLIVLAGAFMLVFNTSIALLRHPVQPSVPSIYDLLGE